MASDEQKKAVAEQIWLTYFNRVLYEKGIISEQERNRMLCLIRARRGSAPK